MANNKYALVNTQFSQTDVTLIEQLNGRQGDSGRVVYFSLKDGNVPHNISNQNIAIIVKDAAGKIKILSTVNNVISSAGGLFSMVMPGELYQASGDVQEAFMQVSDASNTVLSSIPITFTVVANNIIMTANASHDYIESVQNAVDQANGLIENLFKNIQAQDNAYQQLGLSLKLLNDRISDNKVAIKDADNIWEKNNIFKQPINGSLLTKQISFPDFATVANNMIINSGAWVNTGKTIVDAPIKKTWATINVVPGADRITGVIEFIDWFTKNRFFTTVTQGKMNGWSKISADDTVVHNTGNETVAGDKNYVGTNTFTGISIIKKPKLYEATTTGLGLTARYKRVGRTVQISITGNLTDTLAPGANLNLNIPDGFKPNNIVGIVATDTSKIGMIQTTTNTYYNKDTSFSNGNFLASATWITIDDVPE
ncbi:BppU family phage baseplate upper protein [Leuconostoc mesenteroides]|uniref:BppU family phage baseplate upper protein n=1 Tax=Leuconostoc mesenteroides TaxID=1245 RepID=UPI000775C0A7|nr:BppU family phage baseplate upper protein [Leuconostoc mesenteroides]